MHAATTSLTCELGVVDTSDVAIGGTNRLWEQLRCAAAAAPPALLAAFSRAIG
jgi:hypothetical protein